MSPSYDLLATKLAMPEDLEQSALTLNGKKNKINKDDFLQFASTCKISNKMAESIFSDFGKNMNVMKSWIENSFLSKEMKQQYLELLKERATALSL